MVVITSITIDVINEEQLILSSDILFYLQPFGCYLDPDQIPWKLLVGKSTVDVLRAKLVLGYQRKTTKGGMPEVIYCLGGHFHLLFKKHSYYM